MDFEVIGTYNFILLHNKLFYKSNNVTDIDIFF